MFQIVRKGITVYVSYSRFELPKLWRTKLTIITKEWDRFERHDVPVNICGVARELTRTGLQQGGGGAVRELVVNPGRCRRENMPPSVGQQIMYNQAHTER